MDIAGIAVVVFLGLVFGSFATALSYRLPRELSMVTMARSRCPSCQKALGLADLVPLFSWIFLKGKCRHCKASIGWQYPLIETATLGLCLVLYFFYGFRPETFLIYALAPVIVSVIDIDLRHKIIPDGLNLSIFLIGVALLLVNGVRAGNPASFVMHNGAVALGGSVLYGLWSLLLRFGAKLILKREALGLGDVKFYAAAGFWLGLDVNAAATFLIVSGISGIILSLIWKKRTGDIETPFGPSLMIAFISTLCFFPPAFIPL